MERRVKAPQVGISDGELMTRLTSGDLSALGVLYERHGAYVRAVVYRLLPTLMRSDVDDLCHDAFLTLHEKAHRFRPESRLRPWLCGIAAGHARNYRRKNWGRRLLVEKFVAPIARRPKRHAELEQQVEARSEVAHAFAKLPHAQREVLVLHVLEGLDANEIAAVMGISPKTVWTRLHRARRAAQRVLTDVPQGGRS